MAKKLKSSQMESNVVRAITSNAAPKKITPAQEKVAKAALAKFNKDSKS